MIEEKLASQNVVDYLTSKKMNLVLSEKNTPEILKIIDLIKGEKYPIKLFFGKKSRKSDLEILSDLEIGNDKKKSIAILLIIFHVRFNLFKLQIQKTKKEYQREMIDSLNEILITINNTLYQRLLEKN